MSKQVTRRSFVYFVVIFDEDVRLVRLAEHHQLRLEV